MSKKLKMRLLLILVSIGTVGFLLSQTISYPEFKGINKFSMNSIEDGVCSSDVSFNVYNENWFSLKGNEIHSEVYYKERLVAIGYSSESIKLPKKEMTIVSMKVDFFLDSLKEDLRELLMNDSIDFNVKVSGKFSLFNVKKEMLFPVSLASKEFVDNMISDLMSEEGIQTEVLRLKEVGIEYSLFEVGFRFSNKLPFDLTLKEIRTSVFADASLNQKVADWIIKSGIIIKESDSKLIQGEARINNVKSVFTGLIKVVSGNLDYYMNGYALIEIDDREIRIPLRQHFKVKPLSKEVEIID
jgi:LEA14-like dessication related protein